MTSPPFIVGELLLFSFRSPRSRIELNECVHGRICYLRVLSGEWVWSWMNEHLVAKSTVLNHLITHSEYCSNQFPDNQVCKDINSEIASMYKCQGWSSWETKDGLDGASRILGDVRLVWCCGYTAKLMCQSSLNCTLKYIHFSINKLYLKVNNKYKKAGEIFWIYC